VAAPRAETAARDPLPIDLDDIRRAAGRLSGVAHRTPVLTSQHLDQITGASLHLKAEHLQRVGAFKFRGGYNAVAALPAKLRGRGVVAFSSGNHAQAIAAAAGVLGVPATIVMPEDAPPVKLEATRGYGAEVVLYDRYTEDRRAIAATIADERGASVIPPYDHAEVMAGQGTTALELIEQVAGLELLVVPIGGGGLLSGCAVAVASSIPGIEIVGVEPEGRRAARDAMAVGRVVEVAVPRTLLDGQQTPNIGALPLRVLTELVDRVVGVTDAQAAHAVRLLATRTKQLVEPSGAAGLAAVLSGAIDVTGRRVGIVLSGGNVAPSTLARILAGEI
jgi:threo-3-hydroxy-L-aspartate ammonia-lyase